jgi:hypothetical protein
MWVCTGYLQVGVCVRLFPYLSRRSFLSVLSAPFRPFALLSAFTLTPFQLTYNPKMCIDVTGGGHQSGNKIDFWQCEGSSEGPSSNGTAANGNQQFGYVFPDYLKNPKCPGVSYDKDGKEVLDPPGPREHVMDKFKGRGWYNRNPRTGEDLRGGVQYAH